MGDGGRRIWSVHTQSLPFGPEEEEEEEVVEGGGGGSTRGPLRHYHHYSSPYLRCLLPPRTQTWLAGKTHPVQQDPGVNTGEVGVGPFLPLVLPATRFHSPSHPIRPGVEGYPWREATSSKIQGPGSRDTSQTNRSDPKHPESGTGVTGDWRWGVRTRPTSSPVIHDSRPPSPTPPALYPSPQVTSPVLSPTVLGWATRI